MNVQGQAQAQAVEQAANQNLDAYRGELVKQDQAAERSLQVSLAERAQRTYRAAADRLQKNESDFALQQASEDASDRLSLRTKLSNLALDDASPMFEYTLAEMAAPLGLSYPPVSTARRAVTTQVWAPNVTP